MLKLNLGEKNLKSLRNISGLTRRSCVTPNYQEASLGQVVHIQFRTGAEAAITLSIFRVKFWRELWLGRHAWNPVHLWQCYNGTYCTSRVLSVGMGDMLLALKKPLHFTASPPIFGCLGIFW